MTFRKKFSKVKNTPLCDAECACNCRVKCPHPDCAQNCLGGHAYSPHSHWCAEQHWWSTKPEPVSRARRNR